MTPIDIATNTAGTAIPVGGLPEGVAVTPHGKTAYVVNAFSDSVTLLRWISSRPKHQRAARSPAGDQAAAASLRPTS